MKHTTFLVAMATAATVVTAANANTVDISVIDAEWTNATGGTLGFTADNSNPNAVQLRWPEDGTPAQTVPGLANQSKYTFERAGIENSDDPTETVTPFTVVEITPFRLGTFTHSNFGIPSGAGIETARLDFTFGGYPTGFPAFETTFETFFTFKHFETPNNVGDIADCALEDSVTKCDDLVEVAAVDGPIQKVRVGNVIYTFELLGFSKDDGFSFSNEFQTAEGTDNSADLYARFTVAPIPLPAAAWLLLGGLGALGVAARRRRKDA